MNMVQQSFQDVLLTQDLAMQRPSNLWKALQVNRNIDPVDPLLDKRAMSFLNSRLQCLELNLPFVQLHQYDNSDKYEYLPREQVINSITRRHETSGERPLDSILARDDNQAVTSYNFQLPQIGLLRDIPKEDTNREVQM